MAAEIGAIYDISDWWYEKNKNSGPRTEPWGTSVSMVVEGKEDESGVRWGWRKVSAHDFRSDVGM